MSTMSKNNSSFHFILHYTLLLCCTSILIEIQQNDVKQFQNLKKQFSTTSQYLQVKSSVFEEDVASSSEESLPSMLITSEGSKSKTPSKKNKNLAFVSLPTSSSANQTSNSNDNNLNALSLIQQQYMSSPTIISSAPTPQFANIILSHSIPQYFLATEIFFFRGQFTISNPSGIVVNIIFVHSSDNSQLSFNQHIQANKNEFEIQVSFDEIVMGEYYLCIFPGTSGYRTNNLYTVLSKTPNNMLQPNPITVNNCSLSFENNSLSLSWSTNHNISNINPSLYLITFSQGNTIVSYLVSNNPTQFTIPFADFSHFNKGQLNLTISTAFSSTPSAYSRISDFSTPFNLTFNATTHHFNEVDLINSDFNNITYTASLNQNVYYNGFSKQDIKNQVIILTPSKKFISVLINMSKNGSDVVPAGARISFNITLQEQGVYFIEVNNVYGSAVLNIPVYVGNAYPLLPDCQDMLPLLRNKSLLNQPTDLNSRVNLILRLVNQVRQQFGSLPLTLDNPLSAVAQNYSNIQATLGYISHVDQSGKGPSDRAKAAGLNQSMLGQNLSMNQNLTEAQFRLQRSNDHLKNMVNPVWTRLGLGISQDANGVYYVDQQFAARDLAASPLTTAELSVCQANLVTYVKSSYPSLKSQNSKLTQTLNNWQAATNQPAINNFLANNGFYSFYWTNVKVSYNGGQFMPILQSTSYFQPPTATYTQIGLTVSFTADGFLLIYAAYI